MRGPIPWPGGKQKIGDDLIALFPTGIRMYCEPFFGGGGVFWNLPNRFEQEILNDLNKDLINLWRCMRDRAGEMQEIIKWMPHHRDEFALRLRQMQDKGTLAGCTCKCHGELEQAVNYFYCLKSAMASFPRSPGNFRSGTIEIKSLFNSDFDLEPYRQRLNGTVLECLDFEVFLKRYMKDDGFAYIDPPYYFEGAAALYEHSMKPVDHERLRDTLITVPGRWLLSYDEHAEVRKLYDGFNIMEASWKYNLTSGKTGTDECRTGKELLITNYTLDDMPIFAKPPADAHDDEHTI
jgi:DNA adenine methylase